MKATTEGSRLGRTLGVTVVAMVMMLAATPRPALAKREDCNLVTNGPFLSYGIYAFATADVECQSAKNTIAIYADLLRDGVVVDSSISRTHKRSSWSTYLLENDAPGEQMWCLRVSARVNPHTIGPVVTCADEPF